MNANNHSSQLFNEAVTAFTQLPGIGKKTAIRLVLHLIQSDEAAALQLAQSIEKMKKEIQFCQTCHNLSDTPICAVCSNPARNQQQICVVENIRDVISIESTGEYNGLYHILGGLIAPLDGIGPEQIQIESLIRRCELLDVKELIMALSPNIEGDTTVYYIAKQLREKPDITITSIARGVAFGSELEYTDEYTLGRAFTKRLPIDNYIN